jgi:SAM-dependent methyltransferase
MGYPHQPCRIYIVDLPPSQRLEGVTNAEPYKDFTTADGVQVCYLYQSMAEPVPLGSESVDLVWSGESIEHITEAEADVVFREAHRILKPGGYFCLDTPNASLARLQSPNALIHPEHKREYHVRELQDKMESQGFQVVETKGICPMPKSLQSGIFNHREIVENILLSDDPEEGYFFFIQAVKPSQ